MDLTSALFLSLSIILGGGRTMLSKSVSSLPFGERKFFLAQATLFASGAVLLFAVNPTAFSNVTPLAILYGAIYSCFSMVSQWCYTVALRNGEASICGTVYSMGFVIPTLSGMIFWEEEVNLRKVLGILLVIPTLIISGMKGKKKGPSVRSTERGISYIIPLSAAMLVAGSLGVFQKYIPTSPCASQISAIIIVAFIVASTVSLILAAFTKSAPVEKYRMKILSAAGIGICFGSCNYLNTLLAGMLESIVLFPMLNIGIILFTLLLGMIFYREKFTKRSAVILALGISAILLFTFS